MPSGPRDSSESEDESGARCLELKVANSEDAEGDAVLTSWLPVDDVLRDIEELELD